MTFKRVLLATLLLAFCASPLAAETTGPGKTKPTEFTCPMHPEVVATTAGTCSKCKMELVEKVVYVCPMHPEVTSNKPSKCGKCKMALVKKTGGKPITK